MGSMHGPLLVDTEEKLEPIFAQGKRLIAVHAENQARIDQRKQEFAGIADPAIHSQIQDNETALLATKMALKLSKKYQRRLHILHTSTGDEAELLRQDKPSWVTAEVTPQHLLLNTTVNGILPPVWLGENAATGGFMQSLVMSFFLHPVCHIKLATDTKKNHRSICT